MRRAFSVVVVIFMSLFSLFLISQYPARLSTTTELEPEIQPKPEPDPSASPVSSPQYRVGWLLGATGDYTKYLPQLLDSNFAKFVLPNHTLHFFVIVSHGWDHKAALGEFYHDKVTLIYMDQIYLSHPEDRVIHALNNSKTFYDKGMDYMFLLDVDLVVIDEVGDEILGETTAAIHWCSLFYSGKEIRGPGPLYDCPRGTPGTFLNDPPYCIGWMNYETNENSSAYLLPQDRRRYYRGGFFGGKTHKFLEICGNVTETMFKDKDAGIHALVADETHVVKYFHTYPPEKMLTFSYLWPYIPWEFDFHKVGAYYFDDDGVEQQRYKPRIFTRK